MLQVIKESQKMRSKFAVFVDHLKIMQNRIFNIKLKYVANFLNNWSEMADICYKSNYKPHENYSILVSMKQIGLLQNFVITVLWVNINS